MKYAKSIGECLGFLFAIMLFLIGVAMSFSFAFNDDNLKYNFKQPEIVTALKQEMTVNVNRCLNKVSLPEVIDDSFWSDELILKSIDEMFDGNITFDMTDEFKELITKLFINNDWEIIDEEIDELCTSVNRQCITQFDHHLIVLLHEVSKEVHQIIPWLICFVLLFIILVLLIILHPIRIISALLADGVLFGIGALCLKLPVIERLTIGYGIQSAYLLFQKCIADTSIALIVMSFALFLVVLVIVYVLSFLKKSMKKTTVC